MTQERKQNKTEKEEPNKQRTETWGEYAEQIITYLPLEIDCKDRFF